MRKIYISFIIILTISILAACSEDNAADEEQEDVVIPVETEEVKEKDLVINKSLYGRTAPTSVTPIILSSPGEIDELKVENGDKVKKDDHLATILTPAGKQSIKATKDGEIANLEVSEGDMASDSDPLAVITDTKKMKVNFSVTSNVRDLMKKDDKVKATIEKETYDATIASIDSMPDDTGLYPIEATIENKDNDLITGMIATINIPEKSVEKALLVPTEAIIEESDAAFIYVIKDNQSIRTEVELIESQSDQTAIEGEVKKGDKVVINGQLTLSDGAEVEIVKEGNDES